jgi:SAM-dependent methyltransferase
VHPDPDDGTDDRFGRQARAFARSPLHRDPGRLRRLVEFAAPATGERVLDVASGPGIVAAAFTAAGAAVTAVDLSAGMLREAGRAGARRVRAAAERLPFREGTFDVVVCRNAFHHFGGPGAALREMARVLRPGGGRVVIEDLMAAEDLIERDAQEVIERLRDPEHTRTLPRSEVMALAGAAGLRIDAEIAFMLTVDFDEWIARPAAPAAQQDRARRLMEARVGAPPGGLRAFVEDGRLRFERPSLLVRAVRP